MQRSRRLFLYNQEQYNLVATPSPPDFDRFPHRWRHASHKPPSRRPPRNRTDFVMQCYMSQCQFELISGKEPAGTRGSLVSPTGSKSDTDNIDSKPDSPCIWSVAKSQKCRTCADQGLWLPGSRSFAGWLDRLFTEAEGVIPLSIRVHSLISVNAIRLDTELCALRHMRSIWQCHTSRRDDHLHYSPGHESV